MALPGIPSQSDKDAGMGMANYQNLSVEPTRQGVDQHWLLPLQVGEPVLVAEHHRVAKLLHQFAGPDMRGLSGWKS